MMYHLLILDKAFLCRGVYLVCLFSIRRICCAVLERESAQYTGRQFFKKYIHEGAGIAYAGRWFCYWSFFRIEELRLKEHKQTETKSIKYGGSLVGDPGAFWERHMPLAQRLNSITIQ